MSTSARELNEIANTGHGGRLGLTFTDYDPDNGTLSASWVLVPHILDATGNVHHGAISSVVDTIANIGAGASSSRAEPCGCNTYRNRSCHGLAVSTERNPRL